MEANKFKIGLLDFGYRDKQDYAAHVLSDVVEYAKIADKLGFRSIWYGEHYNTGIAYNSPEILLPIIALLTEKINVGSGGVLIAAHSPYRVANAYKVLSTLFPGRIDLGIAKAPSDMKLTSLLLDKQPTEIDPKALAIRKSKELIDFFLNEKQNYYDGIMVPPFMGPKPNIWKLMTSFEKLNDSLEDQTNFCCSLFHWSERDKRIDPKHLWDFKKAYFEKHKTNPQVAIAFSGICDLTKKKAEITFNEMQKSSKASEPYINNCVIGTPNDFLKKVRELNEETGVDYFIFYDLTPKISIRRKALKLLSKEFKLV